MIFSVSLDTQQTGQASKEPRRSALPFGASAQDGTTMADQPAPPTTPTNEDLRIAARQFEYANRVSVGGNHDLAIQCLITCCKLVPTNLAYRQALRKAEKSKYQNNLRGSLLAPLTAFAARLRLWRAARKKNHLKVLEHGESVLLRNPWHKGAQLLMAESAIALGLPVLAVWILQQARERNPNDVEINRALARLLEKQGHFAQAIALWELIRRAAPRDQEAQDKAKQLAASETIARGNYEEAATTDTSVRVPVAPTPAPPTSKVSPVKRHGNREEDQLRARIEAEPGKADAYLQLAALYNRNGRYDDARAVLTQGMEATNAAFDIAIVLADLDIQPLRQSLAKTEEELRDKPNDKKLQKMRGDLLAEINSLELDCYRQKVQANPTERTHRFELGVRLLRAGLVEESITELQSVRNDARLQWKVLMNLGHCFLTRQNWPLARRNFEEALRTMPAGEDASRKELLFHLAQGHAAAGDLPQAIELALDLANLDYSYRNIGRLLEEWQSRAGQPVKPTRK
jgi:tetratricopeptide (TPR) repeat protein